MTKTVFVSGGAVGIGRAICVQFASVGYNVSFTYFKHHEEANTTLSLIESYGVKCLAQPCDIREQMQVRDSIAHTIGVLDGIDVLVCNAGVSHFGLASDITKAQFETVINTNLWGTMNVCSCSIPHFVSQKRGSIVTVGSFESLDGASCESLYASSKGGVLSYTLSLAKELGPSGITANCVLPGLIDTAMNDNLTNSEKDELVQNALIKRIGTPKDVASAVLFLATNDYITGTYLCVDGGLHI